MQVLVVGRNGMLGLEVIGISPELEERTCLGWDMRRGYNSHAVTLTWLQFSPSSTLVAPFLRVS
jgi:hypothetical protein